jgi:quinol monooxygenase YgiN
MIIIRISMETLPEKQKEVVQTILSLMASMEREPGCLSNAFFCEMKDKNMLCMVEEWESREKLDSYLVSVHKWPKLSVLRPGQEAGGQRYR